MKPFTLVIQIDKFQDSGGRNRYEIAKVISKKIQILIESNLALVDLNQEDQVALYCYTINVG